MARRRPDWNPDTSKRDPRIDPKPGDVLGIGRVRFYVIDSWFPDRVMFSHRRPAPTNDWTSLRTWYAVSLAAWRRVNGRRPDVFVYNVAEASP